MKGRNYSITVVLTILVLVFGTISVNAQEITFTGEACPLTISVGAEEPVEIAVESINVLGVVDGAYAVVLYPDVPAAENAEDGAEGAETGEEPAAAETQPAEAGEVTEAAEEWLAGEQTESILRVGFVSLDELAEKVPSLDLSSLPSVENWTDLAYGSQGAYVQKMQELLIGRELLTGTADGSFGPGTRDSVNAFLGSVGFEQTGVIDAAAWFLLQDDGTAETLTIPYPPVYTVDEKFASILGNVSDASVLEAFLDPSWKFSYDIFDGKGMIRKDLDMAPYVNADRPVDRIAIDLDPVVCLQTGKDGKLMLIPALQVNTIGAYRPYLQSATLNCGGTVADLSLLTSKGNIKAADVMEETYLMITEEAMAALQGMEADASLAIRLRGTNRNYDMDLSEISAQIKELVEAFH